MHVKCNLSRNFFIKVGTCSLDKIFDLPSRLSSLVARAKPSANKARIGKRSEPGQARIFSLLRQLTHLSRLCSSVLPQRIRAYSEFQINSIKIRFRISDVTWITDSYPKGFLISLPAPGVTEQNSRLIIDWSHLILLLLSLSSFFLRQ